jgi:hypothetical protein
MTDIARTKSRRTASTGLLFALSAVAGVIVLAAAITALVLWPRWPSAVAPDAPSIPITVGGVLFNVPPAAIRVAVQRASGTQVRLDLAFLWPSLKPPTPAKPVVSDEPPPIDRVFVTIAAQTIALTPAERVKTIYPRYLADTQYDGPDGLKLISFRDGTPYSGEDIYFDPTAQPGFLVRCNRPSKAGTPGMCLSERRIGNADVTVRFPSDWLTDWRKLAAGIETLIASFKASGG